MTFPPSVFHAPRIETDPRILNGYPALSGTRLDPQFIWQLHDHGCSVETIMKSYRLTREQVDAALTRIRDEARATERKHGALQGNWRYVGDVADAALGVECEAAQEEE